MTLQTIQALSNRRNFLFDEGVTADTCQWKKITAALTEPDLEKLDVTLLLTHKVLIDQAPSCVKDLLVSFYPCRPLHFQTAGIFVVAEFLKAKQGGRGLSFLWNHLPASFRETDGLCTITIRL